MRYSYWSFDYEEQRSACAVMKFCQARLSPPLIGQIAAEASLDAPEEYSRETYDEYVERRKCLIDGLNRIPGVYSPIPMGAFYTVAKLPVAIRISFVHGACPSSSMKGRLYSWLRLPAFILLREQGRMKCVLRMY